MRREVLLTMAGERHWVVVIGRLANYISCLVWYSIMLRQMCGIVHKLDGVKPYSTGQHHHIVSQQSSQTHAHLPGIDVIYHPPNHIL